MTSSRDASLPCPRCRRPLRLRQGGHVAARVCTHCGGAWLSRDEITTMLRRDRLADVDPGQLFDDPGYAKIDTSPAGIPCPTCGRTMQTKTFEPGTIALDVCAAHGIWFDGHELEQVIRAEKERRRSAPADERTRRERSAPPRDAVNPYEEAERGPGSLWGPPLEGQEASGVLYALGHLIRLIG